MEAMPIRFGRAQTELRLSDDAMQKAGIKLEDNEWIPVIASYIDKKKLHFVIATPWFPDDDTDPQGEEADWFLPAVVSEKDVEAMRWMNMRTNED